MAKPSTVKQWEISQDPDILVRVEVEDDNYGASDYVVISDNHNGSVVIHRDHVEALCDALEDAAVAR